MNMRSEQEGPAGFEGKPASYPVDEPMLGTEPTGRQEGLGDRAGEAGAHMADVAKGEAGRVVSEAGRQARNLMGQARNELADQAGTQQQKVANGLRTVSQQLSDMGDKAENPGMAVDLVREAAQRTGSLASWLDARDPGAIVEEVKRFARRRPGVFIGIAAVAGIALGRVTRAAVTSASEAGERGRPARGRAETEYPPIPQYSRSGDFTESAEFSGIADVTP